MATKKAYNPRTIPQGKTQVNFSIENDLLENIKNIAAQECVPNSEIFTLSVRRFIEVYEKKNGKIKPRPQRKGLQGL